MIELGMHPETGETIYVVLEDAARYIVCGKDRLYLKKTENYKSINLRKALSLMNKFEGEISKTTDNSIPSE